MKRQAPKAENPVNLGRQRLKESYLESGFQARKYETLWILPNLESEIPANRANRLEGIVTVYLPSPEGLKLEVSFPRVWTGSGG